MTLEPVNEGEARLAQTAPPPFSFLNRESEAVAYGDVRDTDINRNQTAIVDHERSISSEGIIGNAKGH